MPDFYDGAKVLSMKDLNGQTPEIFLSVGNRSIGKTTWYNRYLVKRYIEKHQKFCLVFRWNYELVECAEKFFKDIQGLFFKGHEMSEKRRANGIYVELFLDEQSCGYCVALNHADSLKKFSHLLSDTSIMLFDEFQSENDHYCPNEISKLMSIHTSIARGGGQQVRYLPLVMLSNKVSLINPYYLALGISDRLREDTKYLRGDGYVLEQTFKESVAEEQLSSGFNRAFKNEDYVKYAAMNVYLNDNTAFIEKPSGNSRYIATLKNGDTLYSVRHYYQQGLYYMDKSADEDYNVKLTFNADSHDAQFILIGTASPYAMMLRTVFEKGLFRFRNQECKSAFFEMLKYNYTL